MNRLTPFVALVLAFVLPAVGQQTPPQPKSQEEVNALIAIQNSQTADERIANTEKLLTDFKDTDFKEFANYMLMLSYQEKNDFERMLIYGERTLEINPDNTGTLIGLSTAIPLRTQEYDLDKDEKLAKAEDYAKRAMTLIPMAEKPNPEVTDEQWLLAKKDFMSRTHEALGLIALKRKSFEAAEQSFKQALEITPEQNPATFYYLGQSLDGQGKKDEAIAALDQAIARGGFMLGNGVEAAAQLKADIQKRK
jgi:tetratricopeptide (TPR) repeat protein